MVRSFSPSSLFSEGQFRDSSGLWAATWVGLLGFIDQPGRAANLKFWRADSNPTSTGPGPNRALLGDESATTSTKIKSPLFTAHNLGVKTDTLVLELEDEWFDNSRGIVKLKDEWFGSTKDNWFRLVFNPPWDGFLRDHFFTNLEICFLI